MEEVGIEIDKAKIKKIAILHDFPETTCKHLFTVELPDIINNFKFDLDEIQSIEWHDLGAFSIPVESFRNDWVFYVIKDYIK
jgi:5'-deoxynucleotidase YfbR-like HD superfamily hydrolase